MHKNTHTLSHVSLTQSHTLKHSQIYTYNHTIVDGKWDTQTRHSNPPLAVLSLTFHKKKTIHTDIFRFAAFEASVLLHKTVMPICFQMVDVREEVSGIDNIVENLLDEQTLQDERILTLEQDSRQLLADMEGTVLPA